MVAIYFHLLLPSLLPGSIWALFKTICIDFHKPFLQDAFSLLAYSDPWSSPVGWQLSAKERESVSAALNSAILESRQLPGKPPLEVALAHTKELIKGRCTSGAFAVEIFS